MNWLKVILSAAMALVFVVSTIFALFGAGEALSATFRTYVLRVEQCRYDMYDMPRAMPLEDKEEAAVTVAQQPKETCAINYNDTKREIANGLARFFVAAPLAAVFFIATWRMVMNETKKRH